MAVVLHSDIELRASTIKQIFDSGDWFTAEQIHDLQSIPVAVACWSVADWKRRGLVFSVQVDGREYFAGYQFDKRGQPLLIIRDVLNALGAEADAWAVAAWFHFANGWLTRRDDLTTPLAPMHALDQHEALLHAAKQRLASYVA